MFALVTLVLLAGPKSGAAMCVLTADDFKAAGVSGTGKPSANVSDAGASAYCVYAGKSSATGGVELDVFFPAEEGTEDMAAGESGAGALKPFDLKGADRARWTPSAMSGGPPFAELVVKRGKLVFVLGVPKHKDAQAQLTKLGALVLERLKAS
jgi:hypothetical protein